MSFIGPVVQGRAPPRSDASSPESGAPIGSRPPRPEAAIFYTLRDIAELWNCLARNLRYESPCTELPGRAPVTGRGRIGPACPIGHPRRTAVGADQCTCFARTSCGPSNPGRTACLCLVAAASRRRCGRMSAVHGRHWWLRWREKIDGKTLL